eukprot:s1148_g8.t1
MAGARSLGRPSWSGRGLRSAAIEVSSLTILRQHVTTRRSTRPRAAALRLSKVHPLLRQCTCTPVRTLVNSKHSSSDVDLLRSSAGTHCFVYPRLRCK